MPRFSSYFTPKVDIEKNVYISLGILVFVIFLLIWSLLSYTEIIASTFLPTPHVVLLTAFRMLVDGDLFNHIGYSVWRVVAGFLIASLIAVPLGILMGTLKVFEGFFEPFIGFIRYMPASAFIPLFILWIGLGEGEKIAVIFFGTFFQQTLMVMDVTKNVSNDLIDVAYTLGATRRNVFKKVILPASLPGIVDTLRITFGWAWTYLIVAEIVGSTVGLGYMIMQANRFLNTEKIFVGIIVIGLLGMISDVIFKLIYRKLFPWLHEGGSIKSDASSC
ncbi:MAG: NitT/TauT family transport system permease protein [Clostridia bacterium]|nr:NitT/TauT family transport system permease protein [Clostridia bacterium]MDN5323020.1 NitT/TauT family transport system permease protein [Clostridia bacterium]